MASTLRLALLEAGPALAATPEVEGTSERFDRREISRPLVEDRIEEEMLCK